MFHKSLQIQSGAIFISDVHYAPWREDFIVFLNAIKCGKIRTTQLILMGDIFDLLFGPIDSTSEMNKDVIGLLNQLSEKIEIHYLEGNHDFQLKGLFPKINIYPREEQPVIGEYFGDKIILLHGDKSMGTLYELYSIIIRSKTLLRALNILDNIGNFWITSWLKNLMLLKNHCKVIDFFSELIKRRYSAYSLDGITHVVEGHFHQDKQFKIGHIQYINLGGYVCDKSYYQLFNTHSQFELERCTLQ